MQTEYPKMKPCSALRLPRELWADCRGVTAIIAAFGAMILMGFAALAIDCRR